jgi:hypothetical protein
MATSPCAARSTAACPRRTCEAAVIPQTPPYPIGGLTTSELARYRTALENALASAPEGSADAVVCQARLDGVLKEQTDRQQTSA